jgi:hypothetical protein
MSKIQELHAYFCTLVAETLDKGQYKEAEFEKGIVYHQFAPGIIHTIDIENSAIHQSAPDVEPAVSETDFDAFISVGLCVEDLNKIVNLIGASSSDFRYRRSFAFNFLENGRLTDRYHSCTTEERVVSAVKSFKADYDLKILPNLIRFSSIGALDKLLNEENNDVEVFYGVKSRSYYNIDKLIIAKLNNNPNYEKMLEATISGFSTDNSLFTRKRMDLLYHILKTM